MLFELTENFFLWVDRWIEWSRIGQWENDQILGEFRKKLKPTKYCCKLSLCTKFHPNQTMGEGWKIGGRLENVTIQLTHWCGETTLHTPENC